MKEYYNYTAEELKNYVLKHASDKSLLADKELKTYLLDSKNHYAFIWIVQDLGVKDALILLDNDYLEKIIREDPKKDYKYNAILCSKNECLTNASDNVIKYILGEPYLEDYLCYLKEEPIQRMFDYITQKEQDRVYKLIYFGNGLINFITPDIIEKLIDIKAFDSVFYKLPSRAVVKFLEFPKYKKIIYDLDNESFIRFCEHVSDVSMEDAFLNSTTFAFKVATMENPSYYRYIVNCLMKNNYELIDKIERYRGLYVKNQLETVDNGIFESYLQIVRYINKNGVDEVIYKVTPSELMVDRNDDTLRDLTKKRQFELLCDLYFKDYAKNVLFNLKEVMRYNDGKNVIPQERKDLYNKFINFESLTEEEILNLLEKATLEDYAALLYDDIRNSKNISYKAFNNAFLKPSKEMKIYDEAMSKKYDCDIYRLEGEPFLACVHSGYFTRDNVNNETISLSFIGTENIGVFNKDVLIVGFDYLETERIMHVFNNDSFTSKKYGSSLINKIYDAHDLLRETNSYNEILYKQEGFVNLRPKYVVCMDKMDLISYKYAKEHGLPIVIINRQKYNINRSKFDTEDKYQNSYDERADYFGKRR